MKFTKIILFVGGLSDAKLLAKTALISTSITGNADFPKSVSALADMVAANGTFITAVNALTSNPHHDNVVNKNAAREVLELEIKVLGYFLMAEAKGDAVKLGKTGYSIAKAKASAVVHAPTGLVVKVGVTPNTATTTFDAVPGRVIYHHDICTEEPTDGTVWMITTSRLTTHNYNNLVAGKKYWFRVGATDSIGNIYYSTVVSQFAV